jgi:hypothetical protein
VEAVGLIGRVQLRLVAKTSERFLEQRINIKFCVKFGKHGSYTCAKLSEAMKNSSVVEWHKRFKGGGENVEDDERCGRPRSQRADEIKSAESGAVRRLGIIAMAVQLNLDTETVRRILNDDLSVKRVSANIVRLLTDELKQRRIDLCSDVPSQLTNNFL